MSITGRFLPRAHILSLGGDGQDNHITVGRDADGHIIVNGGATQISGGSTTVDNTTLVHANGGDGNDTITLDEHNGPLPATLLEGGNGADVIVGGSGDDQLFGGNGNDTINGGAGADSLFGGNGDDRLDGDGGADHFFGGRGDDVLVWDPGDGSDVLDGGSGFDEMLFNGNEKAETFEFSANGSGGATFTRDLGTITMDLTGVEKVTVNALAGADTIHIFDPSGTGVTEIDINLGVNGSGDGAADKILLHDDTPVHVTNAGDGHLIVTEDSTVIHIFGFEAANDQLIINGDVFHL
jgi:Ca2+-binding RTX toxin-like protein